MKINKDECYIFGAGAYNNHKIFPQDLSNKFIIAADGGYSVLKEIGIEPTLIIGDFDSLGFVPNQENVIKYPAAKDETDMFLAVKEGLKRGYKYFKIYGGLDNRFDHSLANIQILTYLAKNDSIGFLIGDEDIITNVYNSDLVFQDDFGGIISVFCMTDKAKGVSISGLKYGLSNEILSNDFPLGISNEFIGKEARISVKEGGLIIIFASSNIGKQMPKHYFYEKGKS